MRRRVFSTIIGLVILLVVLIFPNGVSQAGFIGVPNGWGITITYCRDGFSAVLSKDSGINAGDTYSATANATTPTVTGGTIASGSGPISGAFSTEAAFFGWGSLQAPGTPVHVDVSRTWNVDGTQTSFEDSTIGNCILAPITFFNPHDGRVNPLPGDRIAVWCNLGATPPNIDVWGIGSDSVGFRLATFNFSDVAKAAGKGLARNLGFNGGVNINMWAANSFYVAWRGGPYHATGQGDFAKNFTCSFPTTTASAVSGGSGGDIARSTTYSVQPGDTLASIARRANISLALLASTNGISNLNRIQVGQALLIP